MSSHLPFLNIILLFTVTHWASTPEFKEMHADDMIHATNEC